MKKQYLALLLAPIMSVAADDPPKVSAQEFVNLQQGETAHEGFRRAHAKGICVSGEFRSNGQLASYSKTALFETGSMSFIGRFSVAGNNPTAPDLKAPVRSLALSFAMNSTEQWRIAMNTPPVMAVKDPHTFYQQIQAIQAGPKAIQTFFAEHPESSDFLSWKAQYQPGGSFAAETYNSINAFYLVNSNGEKQAVRWTMQPTVSVSADNLEGVDALHQEITNRVAKENIIFDWVFTLANEKDDENNPAKAWPDSREKITAGQIVITGVTPQLQGECHGINYDPLVLPTGIEATRDPILRARSAAYAESYRRRAKEALMGEREDQGNE
ncbi:MAG: catalase [Idiomarina sp.]|jgi:catalase|uniref:Catalase-related peroxidase n=1 Tax=Idiomarina loihiensis (strain ATCC BAA-735 / DSM 15497 / L2-TR) TaxID=283942 RepID=Q5QY41_IDILO|nr:catalase family peroxidase [Idiomarina loihiensis]AAV82884.1 Catalase-related protein [Idiomarina loihiensis L2TR]AGM36927.1 catalase-like protein [Idiomarina loihiensis GSL 199]PHQ89667.1 MAG: catalase [Idiomarina sp.]